MSESNGHGGGESGHRTDPGADPSDGGDPRDESTQIATEQRRRNASVLSGIVAVIGLWMVVSALVFDVAGDAFVNLLLVGSLIVLAGGYNAYRVANDVPLSAGVASLAALLGLWAIVSVGLFEMTGGLFWSTAASGVIVAVLGGYNAYEAREARSVTTDRDVTN